MSKRKKLSPRPSFDEIRTLAEEEDAEAEYRLGLAYCGKDTSIQDPTLAAIWFRRSAEHGHTNAQYELAWCYLKGEGVVQDEEIAAFWFNRVIGTYRKTAEKGDADAECQLGEFYRLGIGLPHNDEEAVKWLERSARHGCKHAEDLLEKYYLHRSETEKEKRRKK